MLYIILNDLKNSAGERIYIWLTYLVLYIKVSEKTVLPTY